MRSTPVAAGRPPIPPAAATREPRPTAASRSIETRSPAPTDLDAIVAIDALHSGVPKPDFWAEALGRALSFQAGEARSVAFVACAGEVVVGFVFAEARAWEFGSPLCGWITAIGVRPEDARRGVAFALCREVCGWLRARGIGSVRTMVRRDAVDVLSFFRATGFRGGPYLELELDL